MHTQIHRKLCIIRDSRLAFRTEILEDQSRVRTGYAANNFAIVRHIVMNLLRLNTTRKASIKSKRMLAATIDEFRAELLGVMT